VGVPDASPEFAFGRVSPGGGAGVGVSPGGGAGVGGGGGGALSSDDCIASCWPNANAIKSWSYKGSPGTL